MSWRSKGLPLAILAIFLIQISSPLFQFPLTELDSKEASGAMEVGFSSGSSHDLEGDMINIDGKNWTVRGESILDYWSQQVQNMTDLDSMDLIVTDSGMSFACTTSVSQVDFHTIHPNGTIETLMVQSLSDEETEDCAIGVTNENRIQVVYNIKDTAEGTTGHIRLARLAEENAVYLGRTWHIRTIAENVYLEGSDSLNLEFDSESRTHLFFKDNTNGLRHMYFNKVFWNQSSLDEGPIGNDIEVKIDSLDIIHIVYTVDSLTNDTIEGEVRLLKFNDTYESRQVLLRSGSIIDAVGMDLDANNIEQIAYSRSSQGMHDVALLRSLSGKDTGRINPTPTSVITYGDDSPEGEVLSGDLNADGMDDLVYTDPEGNGTISIHYGTPNGPGAYPDVTFVGSFSESHLGTGIAIGDFNCDGYDDLASSEPGFTDNNSGHASIRLGSASGITTEPWWEMNGSADDNLGWSMASLGDVESDGCDDLAVVADKMIEEDETQATLSKNGLVMILKGNASSMLFHANITQTGAGTMFGRQIATGGDINGDGFLDMVVSNTGTEDSPVGYSSIEFFMGDSTGINTTVAKLHSVAQQGKLYGFEMAFVGDVHGDGYDDVIISELFASTTPYHSGKVHMWSGSMNGPVANWSLKGSYANALLGYTIAPAGDINEDGYDDFLLMLPAASKSGTVNLYLGSENGPRTDVQIFAQGSSGENVGLNLLTGMDLNGDGMGDLLYSSRNLDEGENFAPVLTILSERDWENINFGFIHEVTDLELHTPQRGSPSLMIQLANSSLMLLENTPDGVSSAGRWDHRYLLDVESADMGITDSAKPTILAQRTLSGVSTLVTMTANGNTGLDYTLQSGTGVGQKMGSTMGADGMQRIGHFSSTYSSIFYTEEGQYDYSTSLVRSSIDVLYPIKAHVDTSDNTRLVYVDDDDKMVRLSTLDGTWSETSILNTTIGDDFDSVWTVNDDLIFAQIAASNGSAYLQIVEFNGTNYSVQDVVKANTSASFELELISGKLALSVLDGQYLRVYERNLTGENWTMAHQRWMLQNSENSNNVLSMDGGFVLFDSNNSDEGIIHRDSEGNWSMHSVDITDSVTMVDFLVDGDRWHLTSTNALSGSNNIVWTTGLFSDSSIKTSTKFFSTATDDAAVMQLNDGDLVIAYADSATNNFKAIRMVSDQDRDLIPDTHDALPTIGNQWEDSDSDGYGDNPNGPLADACPSDDGTSMYDRYGCEDYDNDGWSDAIDDCAGDSGTSWWALVGCEDNDQDGWAENTASFVGGDKFPENWKQALDTDSDTFGDNHGPDCCYVELEGMQRPGDYFPYNPLQYQDTDGDGYGDNPDDPIDGDWCWFVEGYSWRDRQGCPDADGDGASDPWYEGNQWGNQYIWTEEDGADWWPEDSTQWADSDGDGYGDNSSEGATTPDKFPTIPAAAIDTDNDGYPNNWTSLDNGSNRAGLYLDNCPDIAGNSTSAINATGAIIGYYGCLDSDGDGRQDSSDAFPYDPTQVSDSDGDGWGDNSLGNDPDECPSEFGYINGTNPVTELPGVGCPIPGEGPEDFDNDGVEDALDNCNNTQPGQPVNSVGCSEFQLDDDLDGVSNADDKCPGTPADTGVDSDGCSIAQKEVDTDGDGINDPQDLCPDSDPELTIDDDGCNLAQKDSDNDGVNDLLDLCSDTPDGTPVLANGCIDESAFDQDLDADGFKGNYSYDNETGTHSGDAFPLEPTQWWDKDGDGYGDSSLPGAFEPDSCVNETGNSTLKILFNGEESPYYGCLDSDGDGYADEFDEFETNPTQWIDQDLDTFGDNVSGTDADQCPGTNSTGIELQEARENFGCSLSQLDSDGDGIYDDTDACPDTPAGAEVYKSGCKIEVEAEPTEESDTILGMESTLFMIVAGGGGLVLVTLVLFLILRSRGDDFDFEDDDDDEDWFDEEPEDDFMSNILGGRGPTANTQRGPQTGPSGPPGRGPMGPGPRTGPPSAGPGRGPPSARGDRIASGPGPNRGPPMGAGPRTGPPGAGMNRGPPRGPDPRGPARGPATAGAVAGKKVAKRKPISADGRVRKAKVTIDPDLFDKDEMADRSAAIDWTKSALKQGQSERSILMQLQTTGWSAPQSRAIIDLSKQ